MSILQRHNVENANLDRVAYYIDKILAEEGKYCRCNRCRMDVTALALNTLPPHYFVNPGHSQFQDLGSPWILIEVAVHEAMEKVLRSPHHEAAEKLADMALQQHSVPVEESGPEN
jgi:competence protein ComFB